MVNKGFPKFGMSQSGSFVAALKNYNLPDFILVLIAKETKSTLLERGRIDDRLQSMNDDALEMLHKIFVECQADRAGKFAQYRFYAYVSSMYHKCEVLGKRDDSRRVRKEPQDSGRSKEQRNVHFSRIQQGNRKSGQQEETTDFMRW